MQAVEVALQDDGILGAFFTPLQPSGAAVVLLGGSEGGGNVTRLLASKFAEVGIAALGLAYFAEPGLPAELGGINLEYFERAASWIGRQAGVDPTRVSILGASRGSEAALLSAIYFPHLFDGVVAAVPGNVVLCGWPNPVAAWKLNGEPLPFVTTFGPECLDPRALIPAERLRCRVLLVGAGRDEVWDSASMAAELHQRLTDRGCEVLVYPHAGHGLGFLAPIVAVPADDPTNAARAEAWPRVIDFVTG